MKRQTFLYLLLIFAILLTACSGQTSPQDVSNSPTESVTSESKQQSREDSSLLPNASISPQEDEFRTEDTGTPPLPTTMSKPDNELDPISVPPPVTTPSAGTSIHEQKSTSGEPRTSVLSSSEIEAIPNPQEEKMVLSINGIPLDVQWEDNETVVELLAYVQSETITVNTTVYGGFEQVGSLPRSFSRNNVQVTTEPGDIVLYSGNQLVVFFGSNSWNYTMLGHIEGLSKQELAELLREDTTVIEIGIS